METQALPRCAVKRLKFSWLAATTIACSGEQEVEASQVVISPIAGLEIAPNVQAALEANQNASSVQGTELVRVADELLAVRSVAETAAARTGKDTPIDTAGDALTIAEALVAATKRIDALEGRLESAEQRLTASEQHAEALAVELDVAQSLFSEVTTCPAGTTAGNGYCVDRVPQEVDTSFSARHLCGERGGRLCHFDEVQYTCPKLDLAEPTQFFVAEINADGETRFALGSESPCNLYLVGDDLGSIPNALPYFCCFDRAVLAPK